MIGTFADPGDVSLTEAIWGRDGTAAGGDVAVIDLTAGDERRWTRRELALAVTALGAHLRDAGVGDDDVVGVIMENSAEFVIAYHAVLAAGGVVLALDPRTPAPDEWLPGFTAHSVTAVIADAAAWQRLDAVAHTIKHAIVRGAVPEHGAEWDAALIGSPGTALPAVYGGERTAVLAASSGTQGRSKQVVITHHNLVANLAQIGAVHELTEGEAVLAVTPLRHIYGMQMAMNHALLARAPIVIAGRPVTAAGIVEVMARHRIGVAYLVPSVVADIAAADLGLGERPVSLRQVVSGGAPLAAAAAAECSQRLGVPVVQGYGMTEAGCVCFTPDGAPGPATSVGVVVPGTDVRFVDPHTGADTAGGAPGELWIRGPQLTPGYFGDPAATAELIDAGGWLRTGDLAVRDDRGYVSIVGRLKGLIKYKGHQVAAPELEDVLMTHPAVVDAAVLGAPDPVCGELPKAYVVRSSPVSPAELVAHVAARVTPHKRIRLIEAVAGIPRSATGKVARDLLLDPSQRVRGLAVVITNGGRGLGRLLAERLGGAQAKVLLLDDDEAVLAEAAEAVRACGGQVDWAVAGPRDEDAVARALREFGRVDALVSTAPTRAALSSVIAGRGRVITIVGTAPESAVDQVKALEGLLPAGAVALGYDPGPFVNAVAGRYTGATHADRGERWPVSVDAAVTQILGLVAGDHDDRSGHWSRYEPGS
ncbi:SDR family NAD(P)-dependent oxidoreductase [Lentzea sp. E54]|uniref:SDR family NAD(P)-dependent oxidoreductase n=1 Tax=Lentzea xerophila TaxID=3435883 RepID=UPI003DA295D9